jgi:PII-like signaling protein
VSVDRLRLTTYFGERQRAGDRFLADALFDIYARHEVQTSVLLRGVEGFGAKHHLRSDVVLTLSEDLPLVSVAVDAPARIEGLLDDVLALERHGLVTLERARTEPASDEIKLTVYVGRREPVAGVCELLKRSGAETVIALLGVDGTVDGARHRARFFSRNAGVPVMIVAVGRADRLAPALPELRRWPLTIERARICRDGIPPGQDTPLEKLTIYGAEHVELVRRLRATGARGVTCLRGLYGDRLLQLRRGATVATIVVDTPERIARCFEVVEEGLVTSEALPDRL